MKRPMPTRYLALSACEVLANIIEQRFQHNEPKAAELLEVVKRLEKELGDD